MNIMIVIFVAVLAIFVLPVRAILFNPIKFVRYFVHDLFYYYYHKKYNNCPYGMLVNNSGLFGKGKTLNVVYHVNRLYKKYNNKKVWCQRRKKFVMQKIQVISNVKLKIPYLPFQSMQDIVGVTRIADKIDDDNETLTVYIFLGDEFSVQMNSRNFKTNLNADVLNSILTCRHYHISVFMTAQRFSHLDALLRQVVSYCVECKKIWRFQQLYYYDAWELENATSTMNIKPFKKSVWFVTNENYNAYNTFDCVDNFIKTSETGGFITETEILELRALHSADMENVKTTRKYRKSKSK